MQIQREKTEFKLPINKGNVYTYSGNKNQLVMVATSSWRHEHQDHSFGYVKVISYITTCLRFKHNTSMKNILCSTIVGSKSMG